MLINLIKALNSYVLDKNTQLLIKKVNMMNIINFKCYNKLLKNFTFI